MQTMRRSLLGNPSVFLASMSSESLGCDFRTLYGGVSPESGSFYAQNNIKPLYPVVFTRSGPDSAGCDD